MTGNTSPLLPCLTSDTERAAHRGEDGKADGRSHSQIPGAEIPSPRRVAALQRHCANRGFYPTPNHPSSTRKPLYHAMYTGEGPLPSLGLRTMAWIALTTVTLDSRGGGSRLHTAPLSLTLCSMQHDGFLVTSRDGGRVL
jgi:hypothetical protein